MSLHVDPPEVTVCVEAGTFCVTVEVAPVMVLTTT